MQAASQNSESLLLTAAEAARLLRISKSKMWQMIAAKEIASVKIGCARRVSRAVIEKIVSGEAA